MQDRLFAISNIHGQYDAMLKLLERVGYEPQVDRLILLGDYIHYGPKSLEVIEAVRWLQSEGAVVLRGDHEQLFIDLASNDHKRQARAEKRLQRADHQEVLRRTYEENPDMFREHVEFFESLPLYHREGGYLFVHAGVDSDGKADSLYAALWNRDFYKEDTRHIRCNIVYGHVSIRHITADSPYTDASTPYVEGNKINVNFGAESSYQGGRLGVVQLEPTFNWYSIKVNHTTF